MRHFQQVPQEDEAELQKYYESREFVRRLSDDDDDEEASESEEDLTEATRTTGGSSVTLKSSSQNSGSAKSADSEKAPEPATTVRVQRLWPRISGDVIMQVVFALPAPKKEQTRTTMIVVKKAKPAPAPVSTPAPTPAAPNALSMLSGYGSD